MKYLNNNNLIVVKYVVSGFCLRKPLFFLFIFSSTSIMCTCKIRKISNFHSKRVRQMPLARITYVYINYSDTNEYTLFMKRVYSLAWPFFCDDSSLCGSLLSYYIMNIFKLKKLNARFPLIMVELRRVFVLCNSH